MPWRTILAVVGAVLGTAAAVLVVWQLRKIITWLLIAAFLAIILNPMVDFGERRLHLRRGLSILLVFVLSFGLFAAMLYAFIRPIVDQSQQFANNFPQFVDDAQHGRGAVGKIVKKYKVDDWVKRNQKQLKETAQNVGKAALRNAGKAASVVVAGVTVLVLSFLMLLEGPKMLGGFLNALPPPRRERVSRVARDATRAVTGYMAGNLLISVIAGAATFVYLFLVHVPFRGVLALWVGFADLIPLVGATLGAVVVVGVAFLHSVPAGIGTIVFFIVYQQFENHVLQVTIMSKTVDLNPLMVLVSVLVGVELFGLLGALLAIPAGGVIQVIGRDIWDERQGRLKEEPTVGADEVPVSQVVGDETIDELGEIAGIGDAV